MSTGLATLAIASPFEAAKALGSIGSYHWGIPDEGLDLADWSPDIFTPAFYAGAPLKPGEKYVDTLDNWMEYILGFAVPTELLSAWLSYVTKARKAAFALSVLGYIPLVLQIPRRGLMAFSPHGKIVLQGGFGSSAIDPVEIWSASMSYDVVGPDVGAMPTTIGQDVLAQVATIWSTVFEEAGGGPAGMFTQETWFTDVAYYRAGSDGRATGGQWERYHLPSAASGNGSSTHPLQIATAVTLDGFGPRGGRFGRFYLPALSAGTLSGLYPAENVADLVANVGLALTAVNSALSAVAGGDVELVIASGRGSGENRPVRQLRVGRVPDTIRSRRNALIESYATQAFQSI